jgi:hypothetical protein
MSDLIDCLKTALLVATCVVLSASGFAAIVIYLALASIK